MKTSNCFSFEWIGKVLCILLLILQGGILDYYLVTHRETSSFNETLPIEYKNVVVMEYFGFITTDIVVLIVWVVLMILARRRFVMKQKRRRLDQADGRDPGEYPDELPYAFIAWFAYAIITLIPETAVIFKHFANQLEDDKAKLLGQNILKVALCISPILFLLLVSSHHDSNPHGSRKNYVERVVGTVTIDLMDSIDILEILFEKVTVFRLPEALINSIIAFACINFFLPTLVLLELRVNKFNGEVRSVSFQILYSLCYIFLVNVPFWTIRVVLWWEYSMDVSVFIAKNIIAIAIYSLDIYDYFGPHRPRKCPNCLRWFNHNDFTKHANECHSSKAPKSHELNFLSSV